MSTKIGTVLLSAGFIGMMAAGSAVDSMPLEAFAIIGGSCICLMAAGGLLIRE